MVHSQKSLVETGKGGHGGGGIGLGYVKIDPLPFYQETFGRLLLHQTTQEAHRPLPYGVGSGWFRMGSSMAGRKDRQAGFLRGWNAPEFLSGLQAMLPSSL